MNTLEKLKLFRTTLENSDLSNRERIGNLANDIESIHSSIEHVSDEVACSFSELWAALEIVAVNHQENDTQPSQSDRDNLLKMISGLRKKIDTQIDKTIE